MSGGAVNDRVTVIRDFAPSASAVRAARNFAATTAARWGVDPAEIETIVGELAANAYVHARSAFTVSLSCVDSLLEIQVEDQSSRMPVLAGAVPPDEPGGRGLMMVRAIAAAWGARPTPFGKIVWAELTTRVRAT